MCTSTTAKVPPRFGVPIPKKTPPYPFPNTGEYSFILTVPDPSLPRHRATTRQRNLGPWSHQRATSQRPPPEQESEDDDDARPGTGQNEEVHHLSGIHEHHKKKGRARRPPIDSSSPLSAAITCAPPRCRCIFFFPWPSQPRSPPPSRALHGRARARSQRRCRLGSRSLHRLRARAGKDDPEDLYGPYPWDQPLDLTTGFDIQWVPEDRVTLFTSDGLIQIGGSLVPRRVSASEKRQRKMKSAQKLRRFQESSYMDPNQSLCLGALFNIAATNGLDMGRRFCIFGFCRSIEMLSDVVEDTVLEHGGEVVTAEKASNDGLQEKLIMSVAVPLLWGVPPASETLHVAVRSGGGIVDKIYWQWDLF